MKFSLKNHKSGFLETTHTHPKTNIVHENGCLEDDPFLLGFDYFQGQTASLRECKVFFLTKMDSMYQLKLVSGRFSNATRKLPEVYHSTPPN